MSRGRLEAVSFISLQLCCYPSISLSGVSDEFKLSFLARHFNYFRVQSARQRYGGTRGGISLHSLILRLTSRNSVTSLIFIIVVLHHTGVTNVLQYLVANVTLQAIDKGVLSHSQIQPGKPCLHSPAAEACKIHLTSERASHFVKRLPTRWITAWPWRVERPAYNTSLQPEQ